MPGHHHRSGPLSQSNKRNKRNKASKRSASRLAGGKVEGGRRSQFQSSAFVHSKADRRHINQQKRIAKKQELLRRKRGLDGGPAPPRVVGIISLGEDEQDTEEQLRLLILEQADNVCRNSGEGHSSSTVTARYEAHKKDGNLTVLTNSTSFSPLYQTESEESRAVMAALDLCRVCDVVVFLIDGNGKDDDDMVGMSIGDDAASSSTNKTNANAFDSLISARGDAILSAIKGQGIPRALTVLAKTERDLEASEDHMTTMSAKSIRRHNLKRKQDLKKYVSRFATTEFGVDNDKVVEVIMTKQLETEDPMKNDEEKGQVDVEEHSKKVLAASLVRSLCSMSADPAKWVSELPRPYILSDKHEYIRSTEELSLTGYIRGLVPLDVNSLIHLPNLGTYACKSVRKAVPPNFRKRKGTSNNDSETAPTIESDPMKRESLQQFATPDALDGEQNLIGFDETDENFGDAEEGDDKTSSNVFARPAGWSDYQSSWLDAVDKEDDYDHGELAKELNKKSSTESVAPDTAMDLGDANNVSEQERQSLLDQRRREQDDHQEFPDEVQVNDDEKARDRFARYRSLKSFKQSYWDPKENLPESYAAIYHFSSFKTTQRTVMSEMKELSRAAEKCGGTFWGKTPSIPGQDTQMDDNSDDNDDFLEGCIPAGSYITLTLEKVAPKEYDALPFQSSLLAAVALLPHENKVSILHMGLSRSQDTANQSDTPVKSKDVLTFRCGWRTWSGRPTFSQHNLNCDKHKFERFMPPAGAFFATSVFGPITYTPCPVLVFRESDNGDKELVATGSMLGADADRVVVKRIVLTGYPVRVHKRFASVKYMFHDPEDVKWFKPAGLTTKHGLNGKIEESVGEHGTMKCLFNAPIKQHDTVCLPLYKRIHPKFADVDEEKPDDMTQAQTARSIRRKHRLVIK